MVHIIYVYIYIILSKWGQQVNIRAIKRFKWKYIVLKIQVIDYDYDDDEKVMQMMVIRFEIICVSLSFRWHFGLTKAASGMRWNRKKRQRKQSPNAFDTTQIVSKR